MSDLADYTHSTATRRLLRSLVPVVCPPEQAELGVTEEVIDELELAMRSMPAFVRLALVSGMITYDVTAALVPRHRGKRAHQLRGDDALEWFRAWRSGTAIQRNFVKGIKSLMGLSYYEVPAVQQYIGYTPQQWIDKVTKRRLEVYRDDIARHEDTMFEAEPIPLPSEVEQRTEANRSLRSAKEAS